MLEMQADGNLVLYRMSDSKPIWRTGTQGKGAERLVMQGDGNLVLYTGSGKPVWASGTVGKAGSLGSFVQLQNDGNLVIYAIDVIPNGYNHKEVWTPVWATQPAAVLTRRHSLRANEALQVGQELWSPNAQFMLEMQSDGNLVLYRMSDSKPVWRTGTQEKGAKRLVMQSDGNLVLYTDSGKAVWASGTVGKTGSVLGLQDDGNLVIYQGKTPVWDIRQKKKNQATGTPVAGVARSPDHLDAFFVDKDGVVYTALWHEGTEWSGVFPIGGFFPPGAPIAAVARRQDHLDLFILGNDGRVYTSWWHDGGAWSGIQNNWQPIGGFFPPKAHVAAVARTQDHLDLFVVGSDGRMYTSWWHEGGAWSGSNDNWQPIGGSFPPGAPIAVVARSANHLNVFAVGTDGIVYTAWWNEGAGWSKVLPIGGFFPAGAPIAAVACRQNHLDLFVVGNDGRVYTSWWHDGGAWSGAQNNWQPIGGFFPAKAHVAAVARTQDHLDLFVVGNDGRMYTSWWHDGGAWSGANDNWQPIGGFFPAGAPTSALAREAGHLDAFVVGHDNRVYTAWWHAGQSWSGAEDIWYPVDSNIVLRQNVVTSGIDALGGWVEVILSRDGRVRFRGHMHDSGFESYDFRVRAIVRGSGNVAIAMQKSGGVGGTLSSKSRDFDWDETIHSPQVQARFLDIRREPQLEVFENHEGDITGSLQDIADVVLGWFAGGVLVTSGVGLIIFLGTELGSLISTGSLAPGARVVDGVLWLAGPHGTLYALAAAGVAAIGSRSRELTQAEYDWAQNEVFAGTLPPREQIVLTDTIGGENRAFTFPRYDGKITLNMGPTAFDDPASFEMPARKRGEVLIHELVHAWQVHHTRIGLALLADALASKFCEATGGNPYTYGPAGPSFGDFNLEQQAQIVSDWFAGGKDTNSPYYRYIEGNIRIGKSG
jgi:hypothetical protein